MGKTQRMIDELVAAIRDGQPSAVVVASNHRHAEELFRRVMDGLVAVGLNAVPIRRDAITVEGSRIDFQTAEGIERYRMGRRGFGEFWDHHAEVADESSVPFEILLKSRGMTP